jgi:uncharacterized protein (TIGR02996 family)
LVLADWLDENAAGAGLSDPEDAHERAALIRVQVELARPTCDTHRVTQLRAAERSLLSRNAARWLGDLPARLDQLRRRPPFGYATHVRVENRPAFVFKPLSEWNPWRFSRGLLTINLLTPELTDLELGAWFASPLAAWVDEASVELGGLTALERLAVTDALRPYLGVRATLGHPGPATMGLRTPRPEQINAARCKRLLSCANFALVRSLSVHPAACEAGFLRLLPDANVGGLRRLTIRAPIGDSGAAFLAAAPLINLSALDVSGCGIEAGGLRLLANSPHFRQLVSLTAFRNSFGCDGAIALLSSPLAERLNVLALQNTGIGDRGAAALAESPLMERLLEPGLNLSMNPISDAGATALAASPFLECFTELILRDCRIADRGAAALADSPQVANLAYFDLWKNRLGDAGARALAASLHLKDVRELSLRDNMITAKGESALRKRFHDRVRV